MFLRFILILAVFFISACVTSTHTRHTDHHDTGVYQGDQQVYQIPQEQYPPQGHHEEYREPPPQEHHGEVRYERHDDYMDERYRDDDGGRHGEYRDGRYEDKYYSKMEKEERKHREKMAKMEQKHQKKMDKKHKKGKKKHHKKYKKHSRHKHYQELPEWAHECGLPPGLRKQHKIPPGWEKKCRSGKRYYDYEDEFRRDVYAGGAVGHNHPSYQTVYEMDAADCQVYGIRNTGNIAEGAAKGAVFGGLIGAVGGAIVGSTHGDAGGGAVSGAVGGAVGGAVLGGILASIEYKDTYGDCMRRRGHRL